MTEKRHELTGDDAIRLLCNVIQKVHHFDKHGDGIGFPSRDPGVQDALEYLAWGDTHSAQQVMETYDAWLETGVAPWPYNGESPPGTPEG